MTMSTTKGQINRQYPSTKTENVGRDTQSVSHLDAERTLRTMMMMFLIFRQRLTRFLNHRSALRCDSPLDAKMLEATLYILAAFPIFILCLFTLLLWRLKRRRVELLVLGVPGEFSKFLKYMETLRRTTVPPMTDTVILALSPWPHRTFSRLYSKTLGVRIVWGGGISGLLQQALLLQPESLVIIRRNISHLNPHPYEWPTTPLIEPDKFNATRLTISERLGINRTKLVASAVYSLDYDRERNSETAQKAQSLESDGAELASVLDYLHQQNFDVVLLGSLDTGRAHIDRPFPRIVEHFPLGSEEEVVVAASCTYFWTDGVGAWWLGQPFQKPVLFTNLAVPFRNGLAPLRHLVLPVRYQTLDGRLLTIRETSVFKRSYCYKAATRGELRLIRNSPEMIIDAHREMLERLSGNFTEDPETQELRKRYTEIYKQLGDLHPVTLPSMYLRVNSDLLNHES